MITFNINLFFSLCFPDISYLCELMLHYKNVLRNLFKKNKICVINRRFLNNKIIISKRINRHNF